MSLPAFPLFPGIPGGTELAVILLIAILLFGANKIPKLARSTGEAMGEFKKGREQVEQELEELRDGAPIEDEGVATDGQPTATQEVTGATEDQPDAVAEPEPEPEPEAEPQAAGETEPETETEAESTDR